MSTSVGVGEWVPVKDAAERLGLTVDQARRRLRSGQLRGRQVAVAQGYVWEVWLPDDTPALGGTGSPDMETHDRAEDELPGAAVNGSLNGAVHQTSDARRAASDGVHQTPDARRQTADGTPGGASVELVASQRAREMAEYTEALLQPWRRRVEEQAEELGRVKNEMEHLQAERDAARAELEQVQAQLTEATAPKAPEPESAPPPEPEPRRWWQRLLWG
jgi:hypothetical protein